MPASRPDLARVMSELKFSSSRCGGPGGQNVNKVNTKVILKWDVAAAQSIDDNQRQVILKKLDNKITTEGVLVLSSQEKRSQLQNREEVLAKLDRLLQKAFAVKKKRKPTKPSKSSHKKRIDQKKKHGEKKEWRRKF